MREALGEWLRTFGIRATADQVLVTAGAQEGLNLLARALLSPGDVALVERPTWPGAAWAFRWAGAEVVDRATARREPAGRPRRVAASIV